ncbi:hypothetical protein TIFTF001_037006 [Ficus carica]|uniref:Uncharacterized protein n=1 Tax=Ficus carica TaxID=3494 RepID=A0AA88E5H8_FICCA|nr:hypothetical protein TIFTF001_037006 [Ficus carica]
MNASNVILHEHRRKKPKLERSARECLGVNVHEHGGTRDEVAELLKMGHFKEFLTDKGKDTYGLGSEPKEQKVIQQIEDTPSPPTVRKSIGVIYRGSTYNGDTMSTIKAHRRKALQPVAAILLDDLGEYSQQ